MIMGGTPSIQDFCSQGLCIVIVSTSTWDWGSFCIRVTYYFGSKLLGIIRGVLQEVFAGG
jgi:hypothetical protein